MPGYGKKANNYKDFAHPPVAEGTTMWQPETPTTATGTEANSGVTYKRETMFIDDGEQCGGMGGDCEPRDVGQPMRPCLATQWPLAVCKNKASTCLPSEGEGNFGHAKDSKIFRCVPKIASGGKRRFTK